MQKYLLTLSLLLSAGLASGQGWQRLYGGGGADAANAIAKTSDGGYILAGAYGAERVLMAKVDADGHEQWVNNYPDFPALVQGNAVIETRDSGYVVAGFRKISNHWNIFLLKTDGYGNRLWAKNYGDVNVTTDEQAYGLVELADGSLVMTGLQAKINADPDVVVLKTDKAGNELWLKTYGAASPSKEIGRSIALAANGDLMVAGDILDAVATKKDVYVLRLNPNTGDTIWTQRYAPFGGIVDEYANAIAATSNDEFVIGGFSTIGGLLMKIAGNGAPTPLWQVTLPNQITLYGIALTSNGDIYATGTDDGTLFGNMYILKAHPNGNLIWDKSIGKGGIDVGAGIVVSKDGGASAAGYSESSLLGETRAYLVKTDPDGLVFTSYIEANIFRDDNANCLPDNGEVSLPNWIAVIANQYYDTTYVVTDAAGNFRIDVDTGHYTISLYRPNTYWQPCTPVTDVFVPAFSDTIQVSIPVRSQFSCPRNEVDVATPILRRCADNIYTVRYCNSGTIASQNTTVQVILDPYLSVVGSSLPFTQQQDTLTFDVGVLPEGDCQSFTFTAYLDCNTTITKQTHCVSAHIYPDKFCDPGLWDSSYIQARAVCDGGMVKMYLANKGTGNMTTTASFIIAEDVIMLTAPNDPNFQYKLDAGDSMNVWNHEADGKTYRIIAEQSPNYPGISIPTAAVEGCLNDTSSAPISYGFYTMFPEDDADAFVSIHCQESEDSSYNPTYLKRGHPKGYDVPQYVSPKTDLDFLIQFQNSGTDTVQQVIIRDTLDAALDPATVYPGAASHPYEFQVYGNGIVEFILPNTNLVPGSSASEGYVKFRVSQKPSLPCETVILNSAAIYFDFNAPKVTNQIFYTVCEDSIFLILDTKVINIPGADLRVYPNPFEESAQFEVSGVNAKSYALALYDIQGRLLSNTFYSSSNFRLYRHQLPAGLFFYRLTADGKPVASGKLIVK